MAQKKILIVDNGPLIKVDENTYLTTKSTGVLVADLIDLGYKVELLQFHNLDMDAINSYELHLSSNLKITSFIHNRRIKIISYIVLLFVSLRSIYRSDFVYIFTPNSLKILFVIAYLLKKNIGLNVRGEKHLNDKYSIFMYKRAKFILTVSPHFTNYIKQFCNRTFNKRPTIAISDKDIEYVRQYKTKKIYNVLFIGRLDKDKGLYELLDAAKMCQEANLKVNFRIVGDGAERVNLINHIHDKALDNVSIEGVVSQQDEIKKCYMDNDIFILPSYHEGFPRTIYEAMIYGIPIVTTFVGGISDIMIHNYNCLRIKPYSSNDIYKVIEYLYVNYSNIAEELCHNAYKSLTAYYKTVIYTHAQHINKLITD